MDIVVSSNWDMSHTAVCRVSIYPALSNVRTGSYLLFWRVAKLLGSGIIGVGRAGL